MIPNEPGPNCVRHIPCAISGPVLPVSGGYMWGDVISTSQTPGFFFLWPDTVPNYRLACTDKLPMFFAL